VDLGTLRLSVIVNSATLPRLVLIESMDCTKGPVGVIADNTAVLVTVGGGPLPTPAPKGLHSSEPSLVRLTSTDTLVSFCGNTRRTTASVCSELMLTICAGITMPFTT